MSIGPRRQCWNGKVVSRGFSIPTPAPLNYSAGFQSNVGSIISHVVGQAHCQTVYIFVRLVGHAGDIVYITLA